MSTELNFKNNLFFKILLLSNLQHSIYKININIVLLNIECHKINSF